MCFRFCGWRHVSCFHKWSEWVWIKDDAYVSSSSPRHGSTDGEVCRLWVHLVIHCYHCIPITQRLQPHCLVPATSKLVPATYQPDELAAPHSSTDTTNRVELSKAAVVVTQQPAVASLTIYISPRLAANTINPYDPPQFPLHSSCPKSLF